MGKSPGKWIKALLLGKKSSRSSNSKKYANDKGREAKNELSPHGGGSPLISHPVPVTVISNHCADKKPEMESSSNLPSNGISGDSVKEEKGGTSFSELDHKSKIEEGQAAIKIQAAFRCYLARRAYRALWGITKLQALYRGHLVRRQAAVTLQSIRGLVKLQAIIRGRKARRSDGLEDAKAADHLSKSLTCLTANLSSNHLANKLLSSQQAPKPLKLQYAKNEPNSVWNWLERWSSTQFWKRESLRQKPIDVKPKARLGGYALETESGKMKHGPRKNFSSGNGSPINTSESEKSKRSLRKANIPISETVQEQPQSELEKVKLNLRKITSLYTPAEGEGDRSKRLAKNVANLQGDGLEQSHVKFSENAKSDNMQSPEMKMDSMQFQETVQKQDIEIEANIETKQKAGLDTKREEATAEIQVHENVPIYLTNDDSISEESNVMLKDESHTPANGHLNPNEASEETQKTSKRRASFPAKLESTENGLQNNPALPSYMAATKSAKAKTRDQISPRFSSDAIDKNGFARRHSLPSSANRKLGQRPDHPVRAEWRR